MILPGGVAKVRDARSNSSTHRTMTPTRPRMSTTSRNRRSPVPAAAGHHAGRSVPPALSLPTWFEQQVARTPDEIAVSGEHRRLTYAELNAQANQVAHRLLALGVGPESLIGLSVPRTLETVIGILGILKSGAAYVPLDPALPDEREDFILADSGVEIFLSQGKDSAGKRNPDLHVLRYDDITASEPQLEQCQNPISRLQPHHLAYVIYTSGSTGQPKGVQVEHRHVCRLFASTEHWFRFSENDVWTLFHSCAFDLSVWEQWGALLYGGRLVVVPSKATRSMAHLRALLAEEGVTILNQTPSAFWRLLHADQLNPQSSDDLSLRCIIFGGEALEIQRLKPWIDRYGDHQPQLVNMYGITETTVHSTYRRIRSEDLPRGGSPVGVPIPDLEIHLLDDDGDPVNDGDVGEIYVGGAGVARGYLNRPELNAAHFLDSPFAAAEGERIYKSGDLTRRLPDGDLDFVGRADSQVKIRGYRVELGEIESHLEAQESVQQSAVLLCDRPDRPKQLIGYVLLRPGCRPSTRDLRAHLKNKLPDYMLPAAFVEVSEFPLTNNGKLDRRALPSIENCPPFDAPDSEHAFTPRTSTEHALAVIWSRILGRSNLIAQTDFFEQGGDSLTWMDLAAALEEAFHRPFPMHLLLQAPTIEAQAELVDSNARESCWTPLVPLKTSGAKAPFFCVHPGGGNALCYLALSRAFDRDRPLWALQAHGVAGNQEPLSSIEEMATAYVEAIRSVQPSGPYHLGGWSFGGLVAYEMARMLSQAGERVASLAILDAGQVYSLAIVRTFFVSDQVPLFHMSSLPLSDILPHFREPSIEARLVPPGANDEQAARILNVLVRNCDAVVRYRPQPYAGPAILFSAQEQIVNVRVRRGPLSEWSELCQGGVRQVIVPGNHLTMIGPPHVTTLAAKLCAHLDDESSAGQRSKTS